MKKLFTMLVLMMLCIVGANAQDDVIFSADVTATAKVSFEPGTTEITSTNAEIVGGKMYAINGQNGEKDLIGKQNSYYMFCMTNNNTCFKVELNKALAVGDVISAKTYTRDDSALGLFVTLESSRPNECDTKLSIEAKSPAYEPLSDYTIKEGDDLVGATTIYIYRETAKSTYFDEFTITRAKKSVTFINDANWEKVYIWAWDSDNKSLTGEWPGVELTVDGEGNYIWTTESNPAGILFNNGSGTKTADQAFKNGATYNSQGRIINKTTYTATFTTEAEWTEVYAYCWNNAEDEKALGAWPGTKITATEGVYQISLDAEFLPEGILFHNNDGWQTPDYQFKDGATFEYNKTEYTATFTTDAGWENVYAWIWKGSGDNTINLLEESWPGKELTAIGEGVYSFTYETFGDAPEHILFNGGDDTKKTPDLTFNNGRAYKWNTTLEPLFALQKSEADIPAGTTVNVKDADGDVVATLTYGVEGEADFNAPTTRANDEYQGFKAYTAGNGQNGTATSGTVYIIKPVYDGEVTVGVWLNAGKPLYIQEDGTSLSGFDGYTADYASGTAFTFPVKAGSEYRVYCTGSKLGFYGFDYKFEKVSDYYVIGDNGEKWVALGKMDYFADMKQYDYTLDKTWTGKYFAIAPASALNADGSVDDWNKVVRPNSKGNFLVELRKYYDDVVIGGNNVWEKADDITQISIVYYINVQDFALYPQSDVTISDAGYATYSNKYDYFTGDAKVSIVKNVEGNKAVLEELEFLDGANKGISGGTGVILEKAFADMNVVTIYPYAKKDNNEYVDVTGNMLIGSGNSTYDITGNDESVGDYTAYIFAKPEGKEVGFYLLDTTLGATLAAHKAFLAVPGASSAPFLGFGEGEGTTGIGLTPTLSQGEGAYYTLDGRRVEKPTKGLYIVNGKKVLVP